MILFGLAALCLISVPLTGGKLSRLAKLQLRWLWTAPLALVLQVVITVIVPDGHHTLHSAVHVVTYALLCVFLAANINIPGVRVIATGAALNLIAILANEGVMPASATAERIAGEVQSAGYHNATPLAHPHLMWLGDLIPVPGPLPNVLSIGDCIIFAGMLVLLHRTCGRAAAARDPRSSSRICPRTVGSPPSLVHASPNSDRFGGVRTRLSPAVGIADASASTHPTPGLSHAQPLSNSDQNFGPRVRAIVGRRVGSPEEEE